MAIRARFLGVGVVFGLGAATACGGDPDVSGGSGIDGGTGGGGNASASGGTLNIGGNGGKGAQAGTGGSVTGTCGAESCGVGQRCETNEDGDKTCVDNACGDLECSATEECQPAPGGGNYCADISCGGDVDCPISRYCDGTICVDDACSGGSQQCDGNEVIVCTQNGGSQAPAYTCAGAGYFESSCDDSNPDAAGCSCEDDWDCPEFTACEAGVCVGTGKAPTCTLEPEPFDNLLPEREFHWGGASEEGLATGSPFEWSAQSTATPVVINLDDDNGDGRVDERDFPEIVFTTYHSDVHADGVLRAIHGGGPNKGKDYFALCGATLWKEGEALTNDCNPGGGGAEDRTLANMRPSASAAAGDIDGDGYPEIVAVTTEGGFLLLNNQGKVLLTSPSDLFPKGDDWKAPSPAIANLDFAGLAEIVIGSRVITLVKSGDNFSVGKVFTGTAGNGTQDHHNENERDDHHHGPTICVADLSADVGLEIVAGTTLYRIPTETTCPDAGSDWCQNRLTVVWNAYAIDQAGAAQLTSEQQEGFCAVADVLGAVAAEPPSPDNPLDGEPEVIVVSEGRLLVIDGQDGSLERNMDMADLGGGTKGGGAPNIDDFDGDGFPEIATATEFIYTVIDLQATSAACPAWPDMLDASGPIPGSFPDRVPGGSCAEDSDCTIEGTACNERIGQCVCLHNGWIRGTEDDSSRVTSSSVFDFNGDGAAEVVYNDECYFRIYEGSTGGVYLQIPSLSRTIVENPVVADVDNDGNAEIIFINNNETIQCDDDNGFLDSWPDGNDDVAKVSLPNGIDVWGDPSDQWVAARRIWNQNSYHVTNVTEGGAIPLHEPESWKPLNGRLYNTYRSQPRNYNVAPDLALTAIQISSPDAACGTLSDTIQVALEVRNQGDLRVGPGVVIEFFGTWTDPALEAALESGGEPITVTLDKSLEPGAATLVTIEYEKGSNGRDDFPLTVTATIDGLNAERECVEDNNSIDGALEAGASVADLRLVIDSAGGCATPKVELTVYNDGSAPAEDVLVHLYAGDPSQGGTLLGETTIAGPIDAGSSEQVTVELDAISLDVTIWGAADPMNAIAECNDANNIAEGPALDCDSIR